MALLQSFKKIGEKLALGTFNLVEKRIEQAKEFKLPDPTSPTYIQDTMDMAFRFGPGVVGSISRGVTPQLQESVKPPLQKLLNALKTASTKRPALETAYTAERATRAAKVEQALSQGGGQKSYFKALGQLRGELAPEKKAFQQLNLEQTDVDNLFGQIQVQPRLDVFEKITASNGLQKILNGELPPKSQLSLLEDVFGSEIISEVMKKRPLISKLKDVFTEVLNIPRAAITSFDMSAALRQGVLFTTTKPTASIRAFGEMFRQVFSEKNAKSWLEALPSHPNYNLMKQSKLYIANPFKISEGLSAREEKFMTNLAEKIPVIGSVIRASERAYVGFLNKLRVDVFDQISKRFIKEGYLPQNSPRVFESLANYVNTGTGRGDLGAFNKVAQEFNTIFFSPRLIASRFNLLNPVWYAKQPAPVRREAIKTMAEFIGVGTSVLTIAKAAGADVEIDPRSSDFGKIKIGNTRWDVWGGFQQWVRVFSQMLSGQRKTATGEMVELSKKKYPFESRKDVAERFLAGKLAPIPNLAYELLQGQKLFGEKFTLSQEAYENAVPLYLQDMKDAIADLGPEAIFTVGVPGFFGVGTQTYAKPKGSALLKSF